MGEIEEFRRAFKMFDSDSSGTISAQELILVMENLNMNPSEKDISGLLKEVDHNFSGAVDFEESLSLVEKRISRIKRDERIIRLFRVFDRDRNGYITSLELRFALRRMGHDVSEREAEKMIRSAV